MKTRYIILIMIVGFLFAVAGSQSFGIIVDMTISLWGIRWPLIYIELCGVSIGAGVVLFGSAAWVGIIQTKDKNKKKIAKINHEQNHKDAVEFGMRQYKERAK